MAQAVGNGVRRRDRGAVAPALHVQALGLVLLALASSPVPSGHHIRRGWAVSASARVSGGHV